MESREYQPTIWDLLESYKGYSDEIPKRIIHSTDPARKKGDFKVRSAWFLGVRSIAQMLIEQGVLSSREVKKIKPFLDYSISPEFLGRKRTPKEAIEKGNKVLDLLLSHKPKLQ